MDFLPLPGQEPQDAVRELTPEEVQSYVRPHYEATGNTLPVDGTCVFMGIIRGGQIVGALGLQVKLHAQPLILEPGHGNALPALVKGAEEYILRKCGPQWVYLFAPAGKLSQLAQSMGMQLEPWCVLSKLVQPKLPPKSPVDLMSFPPDSPDEPTGGSESNTGEGRVN